MAQTHQNVTGWTGWVSFASVLMMLSGIVHILYGLGSLFSQGWYLYVNEQIYIVNATTGGWVLLILGILLLVSGGLLMTGNLFGRIMGILLATLGIIANLAYIAIAPVWSILAVVVNAVVLYAVGVHGGEMKKLQ